MGGNGKYKIFISPKSEGRREKERERERKKVGEIG